MNGGGGGGSGYFGGGGGGGRGPAGSGSGGGGGGGSSFVTNSGTNASFAVASASGDGSIVITIPGTTAPCASTFCGNVAVRSSAGIVDSLHSAALPVSPPPPPGLDFLCGLIGFRVTGLSPGQRVLITEDWLAPVPATAFWKLERGSWRPIPAAFSTIPGPEGPVTEIQFFLTDGRPEDGDGDANGTIVDPGGPAVLIAAPRFTG